MLKARKLKPDVRPQVLLALEWYVPEFHCGVAQYAQEHNWTLHDSLAYNRQKPPEKLHYDGIINPAYPDIPIHDAPDHHRNESAGGGFER